MVDFSETTKQRSGWLIILFSAVVLLTSSWNDSPCYDEVEHITAGYYYVRAQNFWMNVYHPPLVKDIAGLTVLTLVHPHPHFESTQWKSRQKEKLFLLFFWDNWDPQTMLRVARLPLEFCAIMFLFYYFRRIRIEFGCCAALIGILMMAASPTFLAHARFVTTDAPAAISFFVCIAMFFDYLRDQSCRKLIKLSIATGLALLVKHSLIVLIPYYGLMVVFWILAGRIQRGHFAKGVVRKSLKHGCIFASIALLLVWSVYFVNMINLHPQAQKEYNESQFFMIDDDPRVWLIKRTQKIPVLRQLSWYLTGLVGQTMHVETGHPGAGYLKGKLYRGGNPWFYPTLIYTKEPLGFLLSALLAVALLIYSFLMFLKVHLVRPPTEASPEPFAVALGGAIRRNIVLLGSIIFVVIYLWIAITAKLNLGIRHILPVIPFLYLVTATALSQLFNNSSMRYVRYAVLTCLAYGCASSLLAYPGYLAYFNEIAGGKRRGYYVAIDSNFDWGIDLYRLKLYAKKHNIKKIYLLYFGTGNARYYLGNRFEPWPRKPLVEGEYLAVSAHFRAQAQALNRQRQEFTHTNVSTLQQIEPQTLRWLLSLKPTAIVGDSILIYKIPKSDYITPEQKQDFESR